MGTVRYMGSIDKEGTSDSNRVCCQTPNCNYCDPENGGLCFKGSCSDKYYNDDKGYCIPKKSIGDTCNTKTDSSVECISGKCDGKLGTPGVLVCRPSAKDLGEMKFSFLFNKENDDWGKFEEFDVYKVYWAKAIRDYILDKLKLYYTGITIVDPKQ